VTAQQKLHTFIVVDSLDVTNYAVVVVVVVYYSFSSSE